MTHNPAPSETDAEVGCPVDHEAVRLSQLADQQQPASHYERLRDQFGAVAPVLLDADIPAWLVLGYAEVRHVTSRNDLYARDPSRWNQWHRVPADWPLLPFVAYQDEAPRRTMVISEILENTDGFELDRICREVAGELIRAFSGRGRAELMDEYAHALPLRAVVRMCGLRLTDDDAESLLNDLRIGLAIEAEGNSIAAFERVDARIRALVAHKRSRPGPDAVSRMLSHPAGLSDDEVVNALIMVIAGAQQPTAHWIGNALHLMLTDERFALNVFGGRLSVDEALNEVLWVNSPSQNLLGRWAIRDTVLAGRSIQAGDLLVLSIAAANADPQVWTGSEVSGSNRAHLAFGNGRSRCPYAAVPLADIMARTAIETILDHLPDLALTASPEDLRWRASVWVRGLKALPVEFTPAPSART